MDLAGLSREELVELVGQLLRHAAALKARIAELEGQQKPPAAAVKKPEPPSWIKANRPDRPRKERKKRTHGFARRRDEPTHRVEHATASCPDCQVPLLDGRVCGSRQVITLPRVRVRVRVRARVTEHLVLERACPKCRKRWTPEPDWNSLTAGRRRVGISVQREVSVLREECRLPFRVIQRYLKWSFGLRLSVGELVALVRGVAERGQEEYTRLRQEIRGSPVVYGDETGWRQDGRNGYLWSFSTPEVRYFLHRPGRSKRVVGDEFEGVLVSDFYGAYNVYQGPHQRCWTHLLRDIHKLNEQHPQNEDLAKWSQQVREVYDHAQACPEPDPNLLETVRRTRRVEQEQRYQQWLWSICKPYLGSDASMRVLCQRVERFLPELFTFVAEPRASADNNAAERSLRPPVVSRKISGGTRSGRGSETKSIHASLFGTWRLRGQNPYHALNSILTNPKPAPV